MRIKIKQILTKDQIWVWKKYGLKKNNTVLRKITQKTIMKN